MAIVDIYEQSIVTNEEQWPPRFITGASVMANSSL